MFLFNSHQKGNHKASKNPVLKKPVSCSSLSGCLLQTRWPGVFAFAVVLCLFTALLFSGCQTEEENFIDDHKLNSQLTGTWFSTYDDGYVIDETETGYRLTYYGYIDMISYAGAIEYVSNFSNDSGVIIIKYDDDHKASYSEYDENWNVAGTLPLKGDFIGIYYKEFKPGISVKIGGAYAEGGAEEETLDAAKKAFTLGNEGNYMSMYGTYSK
jgi:hypothetical protein